VLVLEQKGNTQFLGIFQCVKKTEYNRQNTFAIRKVWSLKHRTRLPFFFLSLMEILLSQQAEPVTRYCVVK
jgi:hypothetical protein